MARAFRGRAEAVFQLEASLLDVMRSASAGGPGAASCHSEQWNIKGPVGAYAADPGMAWICRFLGPDGEPVG
jgi:hypothetical protein